MKHILSILALVIMTTSLVNSQNIRTLVVYYSWGGNTRVAAEKIKALTNADIVEITPEIAYPTDYSECVAQARKETKEDFRPTISTKIDNLNDYDVIFVGTPNWCSTIAPPVATFLSQNKFEGKTIVPFVTHGGGGMSRCESDMQKLVQNAKFVKGIAVRGEKVADSDEEISKWLNENNLSK